MKTLMRTCSFSQRRESSDRVSTPTTISCVCAADLILAALILSDPILHTIRRELKRLSPDVRISVDQIREALMHEVIKRDTIEGEKAVEAQKIINRAANKAIRQRKARGDDVDNGVVAIEEATAPPDDTSEDQRKGDT